MNIKVGDTVRINILDDVDYKYHGRHGEIVEIVEDDLGNLTGNEEDNNIYKVEFEDESTMSFRQHDLETN